MPPAAPIRPPAIKSSAPPEAVPKRVQAAVTAAQSGLAEKWRSVKGNVDWEQFTGTKLFAWLGGLALFIGAGFFVKYSIDRNLIPPMVRLAIAAVAGIGLVVASFRFHRGRFDVMRHTLAAGGIGVLYSVVFAATLYYHYLPEIPGFFCLTVISAAAFVLAIHHQGIAISILGAIGAYCTPILVDTGSDNLALLLVYLTIVNLGLYQVVLRLKSAPLLLIAAAGTLVPLIAGSLFGRPLPSADLTAWVWIADMVLFSLFFVRLNIVPDGGRALLWAAITLYAAVLGMALTMTLSRSGCGPMLLLTAAVAGSMVLSLRRPGWRRLAMPYAVGTFMAAVFWAWLRFRPDSQPWCFLLFLFYGAAGGIGPVLLIRKFGLEPSVKNWFRIFPVAITGLSLVVLLRNPQMSFWFWPMIVCLQVIGIIVSFLVGAIVQIALLTLVLIVSGLVWLVYVPAGTVAFGFYAFVLAAGVVICLTIFLVIRKMPAWMKILRLDAGDEKAGPAAPLSGEWLAAAPVMGGFVLLMAAFLAQRSVNPHPGMATLVCFLILALAICRRIEFQPIGMVALISAIVAQAGWMVRGDLSASLYFSSVAWAAVLFVGALIAPLVIFASYKKWKMVWMTWAFFEVFQGLFIIRAADHLWERDYTGWLPLALAVLKLPVVALLLKQLRGARERNAILACHGGVLLFYVSAVPIMLLDQGWIGLTLTIEATALLWLNRRIAHPGLRWTAAAMSPVGLLLLFTYLPWMKGPDSLIILNAAVLATAAGLVALALAVRLAPFPERLLGRIDLPVYFLWLAVGTGFYLANLVVTDIFAGPRDGFDLVPKFYFRGDLIRSICSSLLWAGFGAVLWRTLRLPVKMRWAGMVILCLGTGWLLSFPFLHARSVAPMPPLINPGLLAYLPLMAVLFYLFLKQPPGQDAFGIKNLFLALFLIAGFMVLAVAKSTILQPGRSFSLVFSHTLSMAVGSAAAWILYGLGLLVWPKRLDRPFRLAGLVLLVAGLLKSVALPFQFKAAFGALTPLLNGPTLLYLGCLAILVFLVRRRNDDWPVSKIPARSWWTVVLLLLAFFVLNVEIASAFGVKGRAFSLMTRGSLPHQLGYSLGWLIFSIGMLAAGIKWDVRKIRWAALILLVLTALKIFFKDLWALGQLYRVASFVGLAVVLILVSFLYQRYLSDRGENVEAR